MEILKPQIEDQEDLYELRQNEFVDSVCNCPLCGTGLKMLHEYDYLNGLVKEEAHCPACQIKTRTASFTVH